MEATLDNPPVASVGQALGDLHRFHTMQELLTLLQFMVFAEKHPDDHQFEQAPEVPGVCRICSFVQPETMAANCYKGHTLREHLLKVWQLVSAWQTNPPGMDDVIILLIPPGPWRIFWF